MLKRTLIVCLIILGICPFISKASLYAQGRYSSLQCDTEIESPEMGKVSGKFFIKGKKVRMETNSGGSTGVSMITLNNGQKAYIYFPAQNMAMVSSVSDVQAQVPIPKDEPELNKKIIGQGVIDGRLCDIYQLQDNKGESYKVWIAKDLDFPLKSEAAGAVTYYKNVRVNVPLEDSLFELPQGVQIQDMTGLMQRSGNQR